MMVGLMIYEDLLNYKSGIYTQTTNEAVGGHAVKLIGYGVD
jgi:cathepsin B